MKYRILSVLIALAGTMSAQDAFSLQQAIAYAKQNSYAVRNAQLDIAEANSQVKKYTSIGLPQVNASVGYNYNLVIQKIAIPDFTSPTGGTQLVPMGTNHNVTAGIEFSQLAFDGSYFVGLQAAKGLKVQKDMQLGVAQYDLSYQVTKAYTTVILMDATKETISKNIKNLEAVLRETSEMKKNGFVEQLDVDRVSLSIQNLKAELDALTKQQGVAENYLKFFMGYEVTKSIVLTDNIELLNQPIENKYLAEPYSIEQRLEHKLLKQGEYLNQLNVKRFKYAYLPSLRLFGNYNLMLMRNDLFDNSESGFNPASMIGLKLNIPIFNGFGTKADIEIAQINMDRFTEQAKQFERSMKLEVENARINYFNSKNRLEQRDASLQLAERIYNVTKTKYKEGVGSSLEVTNAERELYQAQANRLTALHDLVNVKFDLLKALGKL